jgi:predicted phosphoribosyltransferase
VHDQPADAAAAGPGAADADRPGRASVARAAVADAEPGGSDRAAAHRSAAGVAAGARAVRPPFADRADAGRALGQRLAEQPRPDAVVLGLPRGGVVVGAEVARALGVALDVLLVRKIGLPGQPELAMGAIAAAGAVLEEVRSEDVLVRSGTRPEQFAQVRDDEVRELRRREAAYRGGEPPAEVRGRAVVLVDDGLATGATMRAAVAAARGAGAARVTVAVPVGSPRACERLAAEADEIVCLWAPDGFRAVQQGYADFTETGDDEVRATLAAARPGNG